MQICSPDGATCISSKFGHQMASVELVLKLATRLHHCIATFPWIALLALSVGIELASSSARVTSVKSQQPLGRTDRHPDPKSPGPQVYLGTIKIVFLFTARISNNTEQVHFYRSAPNPHYPTAIIHPRAHFPLVRTLCARHATDLYSIETTGDYYRTTVT